MTDILGPLGPLRPSDSWSTTEVRSLQHSHIWTVKGFSQCECRYLETSVKPSCGSLVPEGQAPAFRIRLHPQGNKESNRDFTFFQVFCNSTNTKFRAKFTVYNAKNEEIATTVYTGTQQLHGYFEYIRRDLLLGHIQQEDELQLHLSLTITFDTVTRSSQNVNRSAMPEPRTSEVAGDFEQFYKNSKHADFTIICGDRELRAHKAVLAARSPVFAAMLESHTDESKSNSAVIEEIDYDTMCELLYYMYSGKSNMLAEMPTELLAAADRFALTGLKEMADQYMRNNLVVDTVCRVLILADMHDARELKQEATKFIAQNAPQVIQTEGWQDLIGRQLMTEVTLAIAQEKGLSASSSGGGGGGGCSTSSSASNAEPATKRHRIN